MRIIAAMDIIDGKCVRLTRGDYSTRCEYSASPLDTAKMLQDWGIRYLHIVDLDGARTGEPVNLNILSSVASETSLKIDFGGGLRKAEDIRRVFSCGAIQVTAGSIAVTEPNLFMYWLTRYGPEKIILGADCRDRMIATHGWQDNGDIDIIDFIDSYVSLGIKHVICTDISRDGTFSGPAVDLYSEILSSHSVKLTASGGISSVNDLEILNKTGCEGVIIGKAIYEGRISQKQLMRYAEKENNTLS